MYKLKSREEKIGKLVGKKQEKKNRSAENHVERTRIFKNIWK